MTETFEEDVVIAGSDDVTQLQVQGNSTQTQPLQEWEDSTGMPLARVTGDGKLQIGDLGSSTSDSLLEASADLTPVSTLPRRGVHASGRFTGELSTPVTWAVHELELLGSDGVSSLQTALRATITNENDGTVTSAELRAGDFQAVNEGGDTDNLLQQITGVRGTASNGGSAYTAKAVGVEATITNDGGTVTDAAAFAVAAPLNDGTLTNLYGVLIPDLYQGTTNNYALYTGEGIVHLGDYQELAIVSDTPEGNPPENFIKLYFKDDGKLYAKNASGTEYEVGGNTDNSLVFAPLSSPDAPPEGEYRLYFGDDGKLYEQDDTGVETQVGSSIDVLQTILNVQVFS